MTGFVADASVATAWCTASQSTALTDGLLDNVFAGASVAVPAIWPYETANALLILLRRRIMNRHEYSEARALLEGLPVSVDTDSLRLVSSRVADLAAEHELTAYDAAYLELANRKRLPLASRDADLNRAARRLGIKVLL